MRRESTGTPPNVFHENRNITKFEIMDGAPVKGEKRVQGGFFVRERGGETKMPDSNFF